jgi:hypothetical protein
MLHLKGGLVRRKERRMRMEKGKEKERWWMESLRGKKGEITEWKRLKDNGWKKEGREWMKERG